MTLFSYLLQSSLILAVLTVGYGLLLRRSTRFGLNRWLLWLNLVLTISLPLVELPDFRPEPVRRLVQKTSTVLPRLPAKAMKLPRPERFSDGWGTAISPVSQPKQTPLDWLAVLRWVYGAGVVAFGGWFVVQLLSLARLIGRSERREENDFVWLDNEDVVAPFSFFGWIVLDSRRYAPDEIGQILLHESIHSHQLHSLDRVAAEMLRIVFWFNPAAWWHGRLVQQNLEYLVDRAVLRAGIDRKVYQYTLLKAGQAAPADTAIANSFNKQHLKERVTMMNRAVARRSGLSYSIVFAGLVGTVTLAVGSKRKEVPAPLLFPSFVKTRSVATKSVEVPPPPVTSLSAVVASRRADSTQSQLPDKLVVTSESVTFPAEIRPDSAHRYMLIRDNVLYWVITPLTPTEEIIYLRTTLEKYGASFKVEAMKYDTLHRFLIRLDATVSPLWSRLPNASRVTSDIAVDKPMESFGGMVSLKSLATLGMGNISEKNTYPVAELAAVALEDSKSAQKIKEAVYPKD